MATNASSAIGAGPLSVQKANDTEEREKFEEAKKNQSAWIVGSSILRLTKLCVPKCMDFQRVQVDQAEKECLTTCIKSMHRVNEETMHFYRDFEGESKAKQRQLIEELAVDVGRENQVQRREAREKRKRDSGLLRM